MSSNSEKNTVLLQGTILAVASIVVRLIGLLYRVPMTRIIGDVGIGYYSTAFQVYNVILLLSSYSMPQAVSKLMAMRLAKKQYRNANRYFLCALVFSVISGFIFSSIMYFGADFIADDMLNASLAAYSIRMLAPTVFIMSFLGVFRGFFQGFNNMFPTALSQIFEQIANAIASIVGAWVLFNQGQKIDLVKGTTDGVYSAALGAKGGTIGTFVGALTALVFMIFMFILYYPSLRGAMKKESKKRVFKYSRVFQDITLMVTPIIASTFIFHIINLIDNGVFGAYMTSIDKKDEYMAIWGVYSGKYQLLINLPIALATALASSVIPQLSGAVERRNKGEIREKIDITIRFTTLLSIPAMVGIAVLGGDLVRLLFGEATTNGEAAHMLLYGCLAVLFFAYATITNGILHGLGRMFTTVRNSAIAFVVHIIALILSLWILGINIYGVVLSYMVFGLVVSVFNFYSILESTHFVGNFSKTFFKPIAASLVMGVVVYLSSYLINMGFSIIIKSEAVVKLISVLVSIVLGVCVYFICTFMFKSVDESDLVDMPMGGRIARLAKKMHLL
ncbi:MAG: polysaccharide biosynthesis protein [Lachnospiraceae bacterium]|nr:polysaccharide biosynthesis protein [Lachnospiraceae bacterium]